MSAPIYRVALLSNAMHQDMYARAFDLHPRFEIAVVAEEPGQEVVIEERGRRLAKDFKVPHTTDVGAVLERPDIDVVSVCAEIERRGRLAEMVARSGKHLWMDKPLAPTLDQCDAVVAAAGATEMRSLVFSHLGSGYVRIARKAIDDGAIGEPGCPAHRLPLREGRPGPGSRRWAGRAKSARPLDPSQRRPLERPFRLWTQCRGQARAVRAWRVSGRNRAAPGQARGASGSSVGRQLFLQGACGDGAEDFATLSLTMDDCIATISVGRIGRHSHPESGAKTIQAVGTAGTLIVDATRQAMTVCSSDGGAPPRRKPSPCTTWPELKLSWITSCVSWTAEEEPWADVAVGRKHVEVLLAGYRSISTGRPVDLPL